MDGGIGLVLDISPGGMFHKFTTVDLSLPLISAGKELTASRQTSTPSQSEKELKMGQQVDIISHEL